jgi:hypothetical protein
MVLSSNAHCFWLHSGDPKERITCPSGDPYFASPSEVPTIVVKYTGVLGALDPTSTVRFAAVPLRSRIRGGQFDRHVVEDRDERLRVRKLGPSLHIRQRIPLPSATAVGRQLMSRDKKRQAQIPFLKTLPWLMSPSNAASVSSTRTAQRSAPYLAFTNGQAPLPALVFALSRDAIAMEVFPFGPIRWRWDTETVDILPAALKSG